MKVTELDLPGALLIEPKVFQDERGFFMETFSAARYAEIGIDNLFVQDNHSMSTKGVLRGLHYQLGRPQAKLVRVISGEIFDVAVDIRKGSPTFGKWTAARLSAANKHQLFIPEGFAHGFCVLSETAEVLYKSGDYYCPEEERGVMWNDLDIAIDWPIKNPVLSKKDNDYRSLDKMENDLPLFSTL